MQERAAIVQAVRRFFVAHDYLEVETPLRIPAPAPESYIDAIPADGWFLQTSPELCMKRLLAAGYGHIFQISHCWRKAERGRLHSPEFTMLEWYRADSTYTDLMHECEALIRAVAADTNRPSKFEWQGKPVDLVSPWQRISVSEAFATLAPVTMDEALAAGSFDEVMVTYIEPRLGTPRPTLLYDYPASRAALARLKADNPCLAERFELYIAGLELANGFSELIDAEEQRARFESEEAYRRSLGRQPYPTPTRFLEELSDMPPSAGIALGIDRLAMVLIGAGSIDEVLAFPPEEL